MDTNVIYCSSCGTANATGARFCYKCGKPIQAPTQQMPAARPQSDFITLSCPNCGGKLEITPDMERFACKYCGNEHLVRRSEGVVSLAPVVEGLKRVEGKFDQVLTGSDRLAAEQTIQRLKEEIASLERQVDYVQTVLKANSPKTGAFVVSLIAAMIGGLTLLCVAIEFTSYSWHEWGWWVALFVGSFLLLLGIPFVLANARTPKKMAAVAKVQGNLAELQKELQDRRQQLEQLHRYTAER